MTSIICNTNCSAIVPWWIVHPGHFTAEIDKDTVIKYMLILTSQIMWPFPGIRHHTMLRTSNELEYQ